jgi:hypothetical protein
VPQGELPTKESFNTVHALPLTRLVASRCREIWSGWWYLLRRPRLSSGVTGKKIIDKTRRCDNRPTSQLFCLRFNPENTDGVSAEQRLRASNTNFFTGILLSLVCATRQHVRVCESREVIGQQDNDVNRSMTLLRQNLEPQIFEIVARWGNEVPRPRVHHEF